MSNAQKFKELCDQYTDGIINWDDFAYPVRQMIEELEAGNANELEQDNQELVEEFKEELDKYEDACFAFGKYDCESDMKDTRRLAQWLLNFVEKNIRKQPTNTSEDNSYLTKIAQLEQRINDMPTFYYKHSFILNEQAIVIQERSSATGEVVRSFKIANGCTLEYAKRALRISGMDNDSSDIHIHQDLTTTMSERGIHIVVDSQDIVRAVYNV